MEKEKEKEKRGESKRKKRIEKKKEKNNRKNKTGKEGPKVYPPPPLFRDGPKIVFFTQELQLEIVKQSAPEKRKKKEKRGKRRTNEKRRRQIEKKKGEKRRKNTFSERKRWPKGVPSETAPKNMCLIRGLIENRADIASV